MDDHLILQYLVMPINKLGQIIDALLYFQDVIYPITNTDESDDFDTFRCAIIHSMAGATGEKKSLLRGALDLLDHIEALENENSYQAWEEKQKVL